MPRPPFFPDDLQRMARLLLCLYNGSGYLILKMVKEKPMTPTEIETRLHDEFGKSICPAYTTKSVSRLEKAKLVEIGGKVKLTPFGKGILELLEKIEARVAEESTVKA